MYAHGTHPKLGRRSWEWEAEGRGRCSVCALGQLCPVTAEKVLSSGAPPPPTVSLPGGGDGQLEGICAPVATLSLSL